MEARAHPTWIRLRPPEAEEIPYLASAGAPPLRFRAMAAPLPPIVALAPVAEPPPPEKAAAAPIPARPAAAVPPAARPAAPPPPAAAPREKPPQRAPSPVLSDDTRAPVRSEDFLPYFQLPGTPGQPEDVRVPPVPATLPPSSATYLQTP